MNHEKLICDGRRCFAFWRPRKMRPTRGALLKETSEVLLHHKSYQLDQRAVIEMGGPYRPASRCW